MKICPLFLKLALIFITLVSPLPAQEAAGGKLLVPIYLPLSEPQAFGWDESATLWSLHAGPDQSLRLASEERVISLPGKLQATQSFLVDSNLVYLPQRGKILRFQLVKGSKTPRELPPLQPPAELFQAGTVFKSLVWGPDGYLYFNFNSPTPVSTGVAKGIGRLNLAKNHWDYFVEGLDTESSWGFAPDGQAYVADATSGAIFHLHPGMAYSQFRNYPMPGVVPDVVPPILPRPNDGNPWRSLTFWPVTEGRTKLVSFTAQGARPHLFSLETNGSSFAAVPEHPLNWRGGVPELAPLQVAVGPDRNIYLLTKPKNVLMRMLVGDLESVGPTNLTALPTSEVVEHLKSPSLWHRRTAQRVLRQRRDLANSRGLHPGSAIHKMLRESTNAQDRLEALWAMNGIGLMEDDQLENQDSDKDPNVLYWLARITGDRGFPFAAAFKRLDKFGNNSNALVRSGSLIAIRQFNSSNLVIDRDPAVLIREVWTGGLLSTHWWRVTKDSSDPVLNLQYWNAVRPITGFDPSHPMGFLQGDNKGVMPYAGWLLARMTHQLTQTTDPEKFEAGVEAMGKFLNETNAPVLEAALEGMLHGAPQMKVVAGCLSREVLGRFAKAEQEGVATRARRLLELWAPKRTGN